MKYFKFIISLTIILAISFTTSCERDDICPASTPTTPRLIIDFFDLSNQENSKNVFGIVVKGVDNDQVLEDFAVVNTAKLILPLKTENTETGELASSTQYTLYERSSIDDNETPNDTTDDIITGNPDVITINYNIELVFVSRACGFKTVFNNVTITIEDDGNNWIKSKQSINDNQSVEDETTTHFNFFH